MTKIIELFFVFLLEASGSLLLEMVLYTLIWSHQTLLQTISSISQEIFVSRDFQPFQACIIEDSGIVRTSFPTCKDIEKLEIEIYGCKDILRDNFLS